MMADKARLGFIGLGIMGRDLLKQALENPRIEIAALCDTDPAMVAKALEMCLRPIPHYRDYPAMFEEAGVDGVVIAVPQDLHAPVAIASLEAGRHVFCEKPIALNVRDAAAMIAASERCGKHLMIGQVLQYIGPYRYVLERVRSGELGRPFAMRTTRTLGRWDDFWGRPWRTKEAQCGGTLFEVNVHEIDLMLRILGPARAVTAVGGRFTNDENDYEDTVMATVAFENGSAGSITSMQCDYLGRNSGEIYCEKGSLYFDSLIEQVRVGKDGAEAEILPYADIHPEWENGFYREIREFAELCLGEGENTIPGEDGLAAVEIAQACYLSLREGRTVQLPLPGK